MTEDEVLNLEEFSRRNSKFNIPTYNNLVAFFMDCEFSNKPGVYRSHDFFKRFAKENSELERRLTLAITKLDRINSYTLEPFTNDLYEAYKIMKSYGVSNPDLFN